MMLQQLQELAMAPIQQLDSDDHLEIVIDHFLLFGLHYCCPETESSTTTTNQNLKNQHFFLL